MKFELTIYKLGKLLEEVSNLYELDILTKVNLSGGWFTLKGKVEVLEIPEDKNTIKGNNIITLKVKGVSDEGFEVKITGAKNKMFNIDIDNTKYKELGGKGLTLNKLKIKKDECKLRIDEDIIFTIKESNLETIISKIKDL
ncbi:UDP-N-acetylglucosamine pyrophosphorylase [Clostridium sp.]|uniref:UDP-N-acetylglucosamine pyrophosphorylase n=1 Tax=Clostridium sp. TaxID=1506 RepID=UPI00263A2928|nr:UDP-N-acetylglucosamine pyrophosphorylase [Clostridium sp.]